jgi:hypothetical protein
MRKTLLKRWMIPGFILFALSVSIACSALTGSPSTTSNPEELTVKQDLVFGSGSFILPDAKAGLSDLSSYKATLSLSFEGTRAGQSAKWSKTYVMLVSKEPAVRQLTIETTGIANPEADFMAELDGVVYESRGANACSAAVIEQGNSLSDRLEPASFLHSVIGADSAGSETVNGTVANAYTFDQHALGQQGLTQSNGELWVASEGGYVVKYLLTTKAKADYFGDGNEGTLTWDYELTEAGQPVQINLPSDCPAGMVNAPQLPDASNVVNVPGMLTYDTSTNLADATAFYQDKLPALGWNIQGQADVKDTTALLDFQQGDQELSVFITADAGVTSVSLLLIHLQR